QRDRVGRLVAFVARLATDGGGGATPVGLGLDEETALVIGPDGAGRVMGEGAVRVVTAPAAPEVCAPGEALGWSAVAVVVYEDGDELMFPGAHGGGVASWFAAEGGALVAREAPPAD
ncbi:MAG: hypothetical protein KC635_18170, partial [Myxococcales bacterium]|nr:hypothetical protein [Myxococcales bacterium]